MATRLRFLNSRHEVGLRIVAAWLFVIAFMISPPDQQSDSGADGLTADSSPRQRGFSGHDACQQAGLVVIAVKFSGGHHAQTASNAVRHAARPGR